MSEIVLIDALQVFLHDDADDDDESGGACFRLISKLTANQQLLLHHVIVVLRNISAHVSVTRMTSANLAVCVAPALLWQTGPPTNMMTDAGRLSVVVQRLIDAGDSAFLGNDLLDSTQFFDVTLTFLELGSSDELSDATPSNEYFVFLCHHCIWLSHNLLAPACELYLFIIPGLSLEKP